MSLERQSSFNPSVGAPYRGIETLIRYNGLVLNDRRYAERYLVTEITGLDDADIRDSREDNPETDGENAYNSFYGGRTISIKGEVQAGNIARLREMQSTLKQAFNRLEESPLSFMYNDWYDNFSDKNLNFFNDYTFDTGTSSTFSLTSQRLQCATNATRLFYLNKKSYTDLQVTAKFGLGASLTGYGNTVLLKRLAATTSWIGFEQTSSGIAIRTNSGSITTDVTTPSIPVINQIRWLRGTIDGNSVYGELFTADPETGVAPVSTLATTLSGSNATNFGQNVPGFPGVQMTVNDVTEYLDDFDVRSLSNPDVQVNARKVAKVDMPDLQGNKHPSRPFMITMRASQPNFLSRAYIFTSYSAASNAATYDSGGSGLTFPSDGSGIPFGTNQFFITNLGNYKSLPRVRFYGQMLNPVLSNNTNGSIIAIEADIADGDYLEVNVANRTITDSGGANRYGYLADSNSWMYLSDATNAMSLGTDGFSGTSPRVSVYWNHSWV